MKLSTSGRFLSPITILLLVGLIDFSLSRPDHRRLTTTNQNSVKIEIVSDDGKELPDNGYITVKVSGVAVPSDSDWVGLMTPSTANSSTCPSNKEKYSETGDLASLPLLCDYPLKSQYLRYDSDYLPCNKRHCKTKKKKNKECTCSGRLRFHVINIRTDIKAVMFSGGYDSPVIVATSRSVPFRNPEQPLYGHISSPDSTGTSMRVTWVSGSDATQQVVYGGRKETVASTVDTFTPSRMCTSDADPSPAKDFGWHDPGFIHSAVMTGLRHSTSYAYGYGSDEVGWSSEIRFRTPPAAGESELNFLAFGDMGKAPLDRSDEHYIQQGSLNVTAAMISEVNSGMIDSVFHIGDISYATGFLVEWDFFLCQIFPMASVVPYMTAIGNHERDFPRSGSLYETTDSGGECGVAYESYFPMPTQGRDMPWYSIEQGPVHFTIISTEHDWTLDSPQYRWMDTDMSSVNRTRTPWLIFQAHRPMYASSGDASLFPDVDPRFAQAVEPLILKRRVDLVLVGHVHNYERTCALYEGRCKQMPHKDENGVDTFDFSSDYPAPVHAIIGMAGFDLEAFNNHTDAWSLVRKTEFGYTKLFATKTQITSQFVTAETGTVIDSFRIIKEKHC